MGNQLAGKKALVTGGGSGIGRAVAAAFSAAGAVVAVLGRSGKVREAAAVLGDTVYPYQADIGDAASVREAAAKIDQDMGSVDILVNNAGMSHLCRFLDMSGELIEQHYRTNVLGAVYCTQLVLPHMMRQHFGRIINMSSVTGPFVADPGDCAYAMTKAALIGFTKSLAVEFASYHITVNAICPGYIQSDMSRHSAEISQPGNLQDVFGQIAAGVPLQRLGTPQDVANLAVYLASDGAAYITGQAVIIDGGRSISETTVMGLRDS
ncbi:SDR family NAD(P)-dependent oxidoreductase [Megasphaera sueciensis]|jgi:NAD(P)-dependent dehydrogenase (short-subunit alcohol dehydrogenase family)|uniref:SDR family NAD(P)-dependent oxidoreductase n=1 Tax=Megasphaera sueciensis TaxID=349094 RepID=UPI003D006E0F